MYVYELARELGAEPREIIDLAAVEGLGHLVPNTALTTEQVALLRQSHARSPSSSRGSIFSGGATPVPVPPTAPPDPPDDTSGPYLPPIHDPAEAVGPLTFQPPGTGQQPLPSAPPPPAHQPTEPRWDDPPAWDPMPTSISMGGSPSVSYGQPAAESRPPPAERARLTESEYEREYRPDDWAAPKPERSPVTRSVVVGIVGLIVIVLASTYFGRRLGIIGPGADRTCILTLTPVEGGEGEIATTVCVDGYGKEVSRDVQMPEDGQAVDFGATEEGAVTRVVQLEEFCRGAADFMDFREGALAEVPKAASMVEIGRWYDENDGFGTAGVGNMVDSFGNAGPYPAVVQLEDYLDQVRQAARALQVPQAQMLLLGAEQTYSDQIVAVRNFANNNC